MNDAGSDKVIKIGAADNGGESGSGRDQFEVTLPENPTTGYRWQLHAPVNPALSVEGNSYVAAAPGLIGSGGLRSWRFRALKEGAVGLVIENGRSWELGPCRDLRDHHRRETAMRLSAPISPSDEQARRSRRSG